MKGKMKEVADIFDVKIKVFNDGTAEPNFFAFYREFMGQFDLDSLVMIDGNLPAATATIVAEWADDHRDELWEAWESF
jgi:hypothetical protein